MKKGDRLTPSNWRKLSVGDIVIYEHRDFEFENYRHDAVVISKIKSDYAIGVYEKDSEITVWIDDDTTDWENIKFYKW